MIVHMIGNAHIDPIWMWRWEHGVDEALATFASAADRCEEYPEFIITRGESWLYRQVEILHPALFERVKALVTRGQWHITGGQYIQPDTNLVTATSLANQYRFGQAYFADRFGVRPKVGYNVDTFGHIATLPDILNEAGCNAYVFRRPEPHQKALPAKLFRWRGLSGGEVLAFRIYPGYVANFSDLYGQVMLSVESADEAVGHTMCFYGVGNHGGGPTKAMIEWIIENRTAFPGIELTFSTPQAFFDAVADRREMLPVVTDELQYVFPGCYSVMHDIKSAQRQAELLLDQAARAVERFAGDAAEKEAQHAKLNAAWEDLLYTAFHDILPGTSIASAWPGVRARQGRAQIMGEEVLVETTRRWSYRALAHTDAHQIVIVNTDDAPLTGYREAEPYLDFDDWGARWLSELDGAPVAFQQVQPEAMQLIPRIVFPVDIPAGGHHRYLVRNPPAPEAAFASDISVADNRLANAHVDVALGAGGIAGITVDGQAITGAGGIGLLLREDSTDTWTFHADRWAEPVAERLGGLAWVIEEQGPLRARARAEARLGNSHLRWSVMLYRGERRIVMEIEIIFAERHKLLQMPIHLGAAPGTRTDGITGGHITRASGPVEWPVQGWSRVSQEGIQAAVLTHDAYSLSLDEACWQWTLLRSPKMAWGGGEPAVYTGRDTHTDQGVHRFTFALHMGENLTAPSLTAAARQMAAMPVVFDRYEGMNRPSWGGVPPARLWGPAMQRNVEAGRQAPPPEADFAGALFRKKEGQIGD